MIEDEGRSRQKKGKEVGRRRNVLERLVIEYGVNG